MIASPVDELAAAVAAYPLTEGPVTSDALDDETWQSLIAVVGRERLEGQFGYCIERGALAVDTSQRVEAALLTEQAAATALLLERSALVAAEVLESRGIEFRVLKGAALCHTIYPDPALRGFGDIDLLVGGERWDDAIAALETAGARRGVPELRKGFDHRYGKEATLVGQEGLELDLHRTFVIGPFGLTIDLPSLFSRNDGFEVGGRTLPWLGLEHAFLNACYSVAVADDPPRLQGLRDVAQFLLTQPLDLTSVVATASRWKALGVVARAVCLTWDSLRLPDDAPLREWAASYRGGWVERKMISSYQGPSRSYTSQLAALLVVPGVRRRAEYLRAMVLPQRSYLEQRGWSRTQHLRHGARQLRRRRKEPA